MQAGLLDEVYRRYANDLYLYALSLCRNGSLAEELTAETFCRALLSLRPDVPSVRYWLLRVCKNLYLDLLRREKRHKTTELSETLPDTGEQLLEQIIQDERRRALYRGLLRLREEERELLLLFYFQNCPIAEIAQLTQKSAGAVKTGLSRARAKLKQELEEELQ